MLNIVDEFIVRLKEKYFPITSEEVDTEMNYEIAEFVAFHFEKEERDSVLEYISERVYG